MNCLLKILHGIIAILFAIILVLVFLPAILIGLGTMVVIGTVTAACLIPLLIVIFVIAIFLNIGGKR